MTPIVSLHPVALLLRGRTGLVPIHSQRPPSAAVLACRDIDHKVGPTNRAQDADGAVISAGFTSGGSPFKKRSSRAVSIKPSSKAVAVVSPKIH